MDVLGRARVRLRKPDNANENASARDNAPANVRSPVPVPVPVRASQLVRVPAHFPAFNSCAFATSCRNSARSPFASSPRASAAIARIFVKSSAPAYRLC